MTGRELSQIVVVAVFAWAVLAAGAIGIWWAVRP